MTDVELQAIESRAAKATRGPWHSLASQPDVYVTDANGDTMLNIDTWLTPHNVRHGYLDADFIASARTDVPALVAEVRALRERVKALEADDALVFRAHPRAAGDAVMSDPLALYVAKHESGSLPACHAVSTHAGNTRCSGCAVMGHSDWCRKASVCDACGELIVRRDRRLVCITTGCAKSTRKVTPPERPKLLQVAREALDLMQRQIGHLSTCALGKPVNGDCDDVECDCGSWVVVERLERAIKDFERVRSTAHEEAFAYGSLDDDAYAQATSHVLNWVAGEEHQPLDDMLEET